MLGLRDHRRRRPIETPWHLKGVRDYMVQIDGEIVPLSEFANRSALANTIQREQDNWPHPVMFTTMCIV